MNTPGGFTVPRAVSYPGAGEDTARRNIGVKRLRAPRGGPQWFIPRDVPVFFANGRDPGPGGFDSCARFWDPMLPPQPLGLTMANERSQRAEGDAEIDRGPPGRHREARGGPLEGSRITCGPVRTSRQGILMPIPGFIFLGLYLPGALSSCGLLAPAGGSRSNGCGRSPWGWPHRWRYPATVRRQYSGDPVTRRCRRSRAHGPTPGRRAAKQVCGHQQEHPRRSERYIVDF